MPTTNWILQLHDVCEELARIEVNISVPAALEFAEKVGKPFISKLKANISNRFSSHDVVAAFSIFDPRKVPAINSAEINTYGEAYVHFTFWNTEIFKKILLGAERKNEAMVFDETRIEWNNYQRFLTQHPMDIITNQLHDLAGNQMKATYPNLKTLATNCLTLPVTTASIERILS